jgi:hypothetical protein
VTTYLVTKDLSLGAGGEFKVFPTCSIACASAEARRIYGGSFSVDVAYEFDETCSQCGAPIPAVMTIEEILAIEEEVERRVRPVITDQSKADLSRQLLDRFSPGIKEVH